MPYKDGYYITQFLYGIIKVEIGFYLKHDRWHIFRSQKGIWEYSPYSPDNYKSLINIQYTTKDHLELLITFWD